MFEIAALICADIAKQIEGAERDELYGSHQSSLHRCKTAKRFCEDLIAQLDEITEREVKR